MNTTVDYCTSRNTLEHLPNIAEDAEENLKMIESTIEIRFHELWKVLETPEKMIYSVAYCSFILLP